MRDQERECIDSRNTIYSSSSAQLINCDVGGGHETRGWVLAADTNTAKMMRPGWKMEARGSLMTKPFGHVGQSTASCCPEKGSHPLFKTRESIALGTTVPGQSIVGKESDGALSGTFSDLLTWKHDSACRRKDLQSHLENHFLVSADPVVVPFYRYTPQSLTAPRGGHLILC